MSDEKSGKSGLLESMTWLQAEHALGIETLVLIPLGAAAKEHGPHLPLNNDFVIAEYFRDRLLLETAVVATPTISYHFYPAFVEYPGSITLSLETARDLIVDTCRSLSRHGPKRFYILNTGVSTARALRPAAEILLNENITMRFTDWKKMLAPIEKQLAQQPGGGHADEMETSIMLHIAPHLVDMSKAVKDYAEGDGYLTRKQGAEGIYSPSGIWGDATFATAEKGRQLTDHIVAWLLADIEELKKVATTPMAPRLELSD